MSMFGPQMGTWEVTSKTDPRWNGSGRASGLVSAGGPGAIQEHIDACKIKYGDPPADLEEGFWKD